jgi:hypothetical protein
VSYGLGQNAADNLVVLTETEDIVAPAQFGVGQPQARQDVDLAVAPVAIAAEEVHFDEGLGDRASEDPRA